MKHPNQAEESSPVLTASYNHDEKSLKNNASLKTEAPFESILKKKVSLGSCTSSKSLILKEDYKIEEDIFAKYLMASDSIQKQGLENQMKNYVIHKIKNQEEVLTIPDWAEELERWEERALGHFMGAWLKTMGYQEDFNKKHYFERMKMRAKRQNLTKAIKFYDSLGATCYQGKARREMLVGTCRNGWEFFISAALKHLQAPSVVDAGCNESQIKREKQCL